MTIFFSTSVFVLVYCFRDWPSRVSDVNMSAVVTIRLLIQEVLSMSQHTSSSPFSFLLARLSSSLGKACLESLWTILSRLPSSTFLEMSSHPPKNSPPAKICKWLHTLDKAQADFCSYHGHQVSKLVMHVNEHKLSVQCWCWWLIQGKAAFTILIWTCRI